MEEEGIPPSAQSGKISQSDQEHKRDDRTSKSIELLMDLFIQQGEAFKSLEVAYASQFFRFFKGFYSVLEAAVRAGVQLAQKSQELEALVCDLVNCIEYWKRYGKTLRHNYSKALREIDYIKDELKKANRKRILEGEKPILIETDPCPAFIAFLSSEDYSEIPKKALEIVNEREISGQKLQHR